MKTSMYFGPFGGQYVPETLIPALDELEEAFLASATDSSFGEELLTLLRDYDGRPTPLYFASRMTKALGGAKIYLKREDLNHTGAHKINNALGQVLLAKRMGKKRIIAETGAGQHGVATATAAALFGLECVVYMGEEDIRRQAPNVDRMDLLGAKVISVTSGTGTLKDAVNEAIRDWVTNVEDSFYVIGSVMGPHPYPLMVREFQKVIGIEARAQILEKEGRLPDQVIACVGGGSNAMGIFHAFVKSAWRRGGWGWRRESTPPPSPEDGRGCSTAPTPTCSMMTTDRFSPPIPSPQGSTIRGSARSTATSTTQAGPLMSPSPTTKLLKPSGAPAASRGSSPPLRAPTPSPTSTAPLPPCRRTASCW